MRDEVREKVSQNAEQSQTANAVAGKNPRSAAFMMMLVSSRGLLGRRDDRGPIFHAKNLLTERSWRKYIMRHAAPRHGGADYLGAILLPI
jgi:hypothetical protein